MLALRRSMVASLQVVPLSHIVVEGAGYTLCGAPRDSYERFTMLMRCMHKALQHWRGLIIRGATIRIEPLYSEPIGTKHGYASRKVWDEKVPRILARFSHAPAWKSSAPPGYARDPRSLKLREDGKTGMAVVQYNRMSRPPGFDPQADFTQLHITVSDRDRFGCHITRQVSDSPADNQHWYFNGDGTFRRRKSFTAEPPLWAMVMASEYLTWLSVLLVLRAE